jgi:hypothetical protein
MNHPNAHQQLFSTQCGGLSSCWARAAREEARQAAHGLPDAANGPAAARGSRFSRLGTWAGVAGLAFVAGATGMLALWVSALPLDAKAAQPGHAQAASIARTPA